MDNMANDDLPPPALATGSGDLECSADFPLYSSSSPEHGGAALMNPDFLQGYLLVSPDFSPESPTA